MPDHLVVIIFAVIHPIAGFIAYRRWLSKIEAGMPVNRKLLYLHTIGWHWALFVLAIVVWALSGRGWGTLGFGLDLNLRFWAACGLTIAGTVVMVLQLRQVASASQEEVTRLKADFGQLILMMPHNGSELMRFNMLSITAGVVEETLWRGFLIWYLAQFVPLSAAAVISAVGFGIAHGYQGLTNVPKVMLVGAIFSGLYVLSGSLWLPMILHAVVDLLQGRLVFDVLRRDDYATSS